MKSPSNCLAIRVRWRTSLWKRPWVTTPAKSLVANFRQNLPPEWAGRKIKRSFLNFFEFFCHISTDGWDLFACRSAGTLGPFASSQQLAASGGEAGKETLATILVARSCPLPPRSTTRSTAFATFILPGCTPCCHGDPWCACRPGSTMDPNISPSFMAWELEIVNANPIWHVDDQFFVVLSLLQ